MEKWLFTAPSQIGYALLSLVVVFAATTILTRLVGLRSFSKMSAVDFAMTIAVGSLLASIAVSSSPPLLQGLAILAGIFAIQSLTARLRQWSSSFRSAVENKPLLLMDGATILDENLKAAKVTRTDLVAKLREANVLDFDEVHAVVFETTGDVSVLHSSDGKSLNSALLEGVGR